MQPDELDEAGDLGLGLAQPQAAPVGAHALGQDRQVEDQRRIGEHQLAEVHHDVAAALHRTGEGPAPQSLRGQVLVAGTAQHPTLVVVADDGAEPSERSRLDSTPELDAHRRRSHRSAHERDRPRARARFRRAGAGLRRRDRGRRRRDHVHAHQPGLPDRPAGLRPDARVRGGGRGCGVRRAPDGVQPALVARAHERRRQVRPRLLSGAGATRSAPPGRRRSAGAGARPRAGRRRRRAHRALVGVIDTGVDAGHPDFTGKVAAAVDQDDDPGAGPPTADENGHGSHVASLACAATGNGLGIAGAGFDCRLAVEKTDLTDASIARSIVDATDRRALAINMSFGDRGSRPPVAAIVAAVDYAVAHDVVLVAAARDDRTDALGQPVEDQGQPANLLQPEGTGPTLNAGRGLSVTASTIQDRPSGAGQGTQISLAAPGSMFEFQGGGGGPPGLLAVAPAGHADLLDGPLPVGSNTCRCRTTVDGATYAYLQGTSMAAPQVTAAAALVRALNRDLHALEVGRLLQLAARRPAGAGWSAELGWGVLDAGAGLP